MKNIFICQWSIKTVLIWMLIICGVAILLSRIPDVIHAKHVRPVVPTWYAVNTAALQLGMGEPFTNSAPELFHLLVYSNRYTISGTVYQCIVAADSWDYHSHSNLLAFTTNGVYLFVDSHGARTVSDFHDLQAYCK